MGASKEIPNPSKIWVEIKGRRKEAVEAKDKAKQVKEERKRSKEWEAKRLESVKRYEECEGCGRTIVEILAYFEDMANGKEEGHNGYEELGFYGNDFTQGLSREKVISDKELVNLCNTMHEMDLDAEALNHHLGNAAFDYNNPLLYSDDDIQWIGIMGHFQFDARNNFLAMLLTHIEQGEPR